MALYYLVDDVDRDLAIDVYGLVHSMREQRVNMIQTLVSQVLLDC
jgi:hypothetical protein